MYPSKVMEKKYKRKCPSCNRKLSHTTKYVRDRSKRDNITCRSCSMKGISPWNTGLTKHTDVRMKELSYRMIKDNPAKQKNVKLKMGISAKKRGRTQPIDFKMPEQAKQKQSKTRKELKLSGEKSGRFGIALYDIWLNKYGKKEANKRESNRIKKIRLTTLKNIEERAGQVRPNYNFDACKIIEGFNKFGYNFQHAENGGEICVAGYFPDGLDEKRKLIVEIDESYHFDVGGNLRQKDVDRQKYLENKGYKIIRIKI